MLKSIAKMKCPRCHKGDIFANKNSFKLSTVSKLNDHCSCCGLYFEPEPGFYIGAMYVSYALGVAFFLMCFFGLYFGLHFSGAAFLGTYIAGMLALWPWMFRISRVIYLYLFVRYDRTMEKMCEHQR